MTTESPTTQPASQPFPEPGTEWFAVINGVPNYTKVVGNDGTNVIFNIGSPDKPETRTYKLNVFLSVYEPCTQSDYPYQKPATATGTDPVLPSQPVVDVDSNGIAIAGFVCSLVGLAIGCIGGFVLSPLGLIFSAQGLNRKKHWGLACAGLVMGIVGTAWLIIALCFYGTAIFGMQSAMHDATKAYQQEVDRQSRQMQR